MTTRGHGGPQRITRAHPILLSEGEEDTVEAQAGDLELEAGATEEAVIDSFRVMNVQGLESEPVVRPKISKVSTPQGEAEGIVVGQDFLLEMRKFMQQQQRNEKILFDELNGLKATIFQKPKTGWESVEQLSQQTHYPLPTPRTLPQASGGRAMLSEPPQTQPEDHLPGMSPPPVASFRHYHEPRIPAFVEGEDVESFFVRFERIARTWGWQTDEWAARVVTLLTGKALEAYAGMDDQSSGSYVDIKAAVLAKYNVTEETYRLRFRSLTVPTGESVRETYNRIKGLYKRWMRPEMKNKEQLGETIILEQYLRVLRPDVRVWVKENQPLTGEGAARLAERYMAAHREPPRTSKGTVTVGRSKVEEPMDKTMGVPGKYSNATLICFYCQQPGHKASLCPLRKPKVTNMCYVPRNEGLGESATSTEKHSHLIMVTVNGQHAQALVDTGSTQTLVKSDLLNCEMLNYGDTVCLGCVHGDEHIYPTAEVSVVIEEQAYLLRVGVVEKLAFDVVLGEDFPYLTDLVGSVSKMCAVVTRSQTKGLQPLPNADGDLFSNAGKDRKSKKQRRQEKHKGKDRIQESLPNLPDSGSELINSHWLVPENFRELQKEDVALQPLFAKVCEVDGKPVGVPKFGGDRYILKNNLLYLADLESPRLVVPKALHQMILHLGHTIPWSGHLGRQKTYERVSQRFYWPKMYQDVQDYCKTCTECQMVAPVRTADRSYLQPLPIIGTPFERIGMDIIGPLVKSSSGHQFALVICDYATRYPEVYPLRSVQVKHIVRCLVDLISRVGVPSEIITDQGTNFMAKVMKLLYKQLGIQGIRTTPFHPQTDGLVERFNGTLKNMLKKFVDESGRDWDKWIPFLLFAYREVPQCSTGFSPFELLFGRQVRGPLDVLKEGWTSEEPAQCSIASYILQMRDKLENFRTLAKENLAAAQRRQKVWYDTHARGRNYEPGQKVLLLLPSGTSKLLAKWQGPYVVTRKLGPVTYEILCPERKQPKQVLHVNLLREFKERGSDLTGPEDVKDQVMMVRAIEEEEDEPDMEPVRSLLKAPECYSSLNNQQQQQLTEVLQSFPSLFQKRPGRTEILTHNIILKDTTPIRQKPYRVPEKMVEQLKTEIKTMLEMGIIEPSKSEWSSPILLVPKKDGGVRFCTDFRKLNSVSCFDSYPMPRIDELIERLGKASFMTTLDLCKGYWQVPLDPSCKPYTAFRSPSGLYQYTVMPFGLHGAPATFQRLMDRVLTGCEQYAAAYLDDVVIYSGSWQEHLRHLEDILKRLQEAGLTINTTKCSWAQTEVRYLGYLLGHGQIRPQVEKLKAIQNIARPQTKKQVRSFLGLIGWYRRFVPHFASLATPLTDLTKKSPAKFCWTSECEEAFKALKNLLCNEPVLQSPNFTQRFIVQVDASDVGLGAVLVQGEAHDERPVLFLSRKLFERERKYSTIEKEGLAIKWAVDSLRYYLLGREFTLRSDHRALKWMQTMQNSNSRILRWCLTLQPYVFTIEHCPGKKNIIADYLSRLPNLDHPEGEEGGKCDVAHMGQMKTP